MKREGALVAANVNKPCLTPPDPVPSVRLHRAAQWMRSAGQVLKSPGGTARACASFFPWLRQMAKPWNHPADFLHLERQSAGSSSVFFRGLRENFNDAILRRRRIDRRQSIRLGYKICQFIQKAAVQCCSLASGYPLGAF